jgi:hypothetical protein
MELHAYHPSYDRKHKNGKIMFQASLSKKQDHISETTTAKKA